MNEEWLATLIRISTYSEEALSHYLLNQDPLIQKIAFDKRGPLIQQALATGRALAKRMTITADLNEVLSIIQIETLPIPQKNQRYYQLAEFQLPHTIRICRGMLEETETIIRQHDALAFLTKQAGLYDIILAHELYHFYEQRDQLWTTQKQLQYRIAFLQKNVRVHALSEIAAMSFVKELYKMNYSPIILNPLIISIFNQELGDGLLADLEKYHKM